MPGSRTSKGNNRPNPGPAAGGRVGRYARGEVAYVRLPRAQILASVSLLATIFAFVSLPRPALAATPSNGTLISAPDGSLFLTYAGQRHAVDPATLRAFDIPETSTRVLTQARLEAVSEGARIPQWNNGTFLRSSGNERFLLLNGLHQIPDDATFSAYGWSGGLGFPPVPVEAVDDRLLAALPRALPIAATAPASDAARFDPGYCTFWVAQRRIVPWNGNAIEWYANAQALGFVVGAVPVPGAILVRQSATWSGYGHVAYVESVAGTKFSVSEMNVNRVGELTTASYDRRDGLPPGVVGFVYWRYGPAPATPSTVAGSGSRTPAGPTR